PDLLQRHYRQDLLQRGSLSRCRQRTEPVYRRLCGLSQHLGRRDARLRGAAPVAFHVAPRLESPCDITVVLRRHEATDNILDKAEPGRLASRRQVGNVRYPRLVLVPASAGPPPDVMSAEI